MISSTQSSAYHEKFIGDRYERLNQGVDVLATDPAVSDATYPFNDVGLRALVAAISTHRLFDHLSEPAANMVIAMVLLDFHGGVDEVAVRIRHLLVPAGRPDYDTLAVVSGLASVLALMVDTDAWLPATTRESS